MPSQTAKKKYPAQLVIVTTDAVADRIRREAAEQGVSIAEVARYYLETGMAEHDTRADGPGPREVAARELLSQAHHPTAEAEAATRRADLIASRHAVTI